MKVLAFDTANNNNDVVILDGEKIIAENKVNDASSQAETLVPSIEKCLNDAGIWYDNIDIVASTKGPGNFTGIRIGFTVAKTINMVNKNIELITINNLESLAFDYVNDFEGKLLAVLDARLEEFFIQEFDIKAGVLKTTQKNPKLIKCQDINDFLPSGQFLLAGDGKNIAFDLIKNKSNCTISTKEDIVKARNIALLAQQIKDTKREVDNEILYVRKVNISKPKN